MEVWQIKGLDCSVKENRKKLLKEVMKVTKQEEKPTEEFLERFARSVGKKYDMPINIVKYVKSGMFISYKYDKDAYGSFTARSYYESLCKYILLIRAHVKFKSLKEIL